MAHVPGVCITLRVQADTCKGRLKKDLTGCSRSSEIFVPVTKESLKVSEEDNDVIRAVL